MTTRGRIIGIRCRVAASGYNGPARPTQAYLWAEAMMGHTVMMRNVAEEDRFVAEQLRSGDTVVMPTGANSDRLAYAIAYCGQRDGIKVMRIKFAELQLHMRQTNRDESQVMTYVYRFMKHLFQEVTQYDVGVWRRKHKLDQGKLPF